MTRRWQMLMTDRSWWLFASPKCMKRLAPQTAKPRAEGRDGVTPGGSGSPVPGPPRLSPRSRSARCRGSLPRLGARHSPSPPPPHRGHPPKLSPAACARSRSPPGENVLCAALSVQRARGGGRLPPSCLPPSARPPAEPRRGSRIAPPRRAQRGARAAHPPRPAE